MTTWATSTASGGSAMSRRRRILLVLLAGGTLATVPATPGEAQSLLANPDPTSIERDAPQAGAPHDCPTIMTISCKLVGGAADVIGDVGTDVAGGAASAIGDSALDGISSWVGTGAAWLVKRIARSVDQSTRPELTAPWFDRQYRSMLGLALVLAMAFLLISLGSAALKGDVAAAARSAFVALPLAVIACFAAVTLVQLLLLATDDATAQLTARTGDDTTKFFKTLAGVLGGEGPLPGFIAMLGALLAAVLCLVVWIELILREAAIYLAVGFLPLSLAAIVWQRTAHLARQLVEGLIAIILAKLTIAAAVSFAAAALTNGGSGQGGMTTVLGGCATLFLAALSPWALMRLIPMAGEQLGMRRGAVKQAARSAPGASSATTVVRMGMATAFSAGAAAPVAAGAAVAGGAGARWKPSPAPPDKPAPPPVAPADGGQGGGGQHGA